MKPPKPRVGSKFDDRWPPAVAARGFVAVPKCLITCQSSLDITQAELGILVHLLSYKYSNQDPYPSVMTIAKNSGQSHQAVRAKITSLETKGLLKRRLRTGQTTEYDFSPLMHSLERHDCHNPTRKQAGVYSKSSTPPYLNPNTKEEVLRRKVKNNNDLKSIGDILRRSPRPP